MLFFNSRKIYIVTCLAIKNKVVLARSIALGELCLLG